MKIVTDFHSLQFFSTERLVAKSVKATDFELFMKMHSNSKVMETLGGLRDEHQTKAYLATNIEHWEQHGFGPWMFYLKETHEWVGRGGLRLVEVAGQTEIEVYYALMPAYWDQGYATEIAIASIEIAFEILRLDNIVSFTLHSNLASQSVMKNAGFSFEKEIIYADLPHVLYRIKNTRTVDVVPYQKNWPQIFQQESEKIVAVLGGHLREIYHFGSTAIPQMPAKPVIDILLVCENLDEISDITQKLNSLNYFHVSRHITPHRSFFTRRREDSVSFHLHIRERGDPQINRHILFRDYLIAHLQDANRYAALKINLAEQYREDIYSYVSGKDKLIQEIDANAKVWQDRKRNFLPPQTGLEAKYWSLEKILKAMDANLNVHMTHFAQYLKPVELVRLPEYTLVISHLMDDTFNYVLAAQFSETDPKIQEISAYFSKKHIPFSWWVSPLDQPKNLSDNLEKQGYENTENNIAMYFDLDAWDDNISNLPELQIIQAKDEKSLQDFACVLTNDVACFKQYYHMIAEILTEEDPIEFFVGYVHGKPVVRGLTCYFAQVAGLYWLSTAVNERKQGYAKAMHHFRLKRAKTRGYHIAVVQASQEAVTLNQTLGFKICGSFREFKKHQNAIL